MHGPRPAARASRRGGRLLGLLLVAAAIYGAAALAMALMAADNSGPESAAAAPADQPAGGEGWVELTDIELGGTDLIGADPDEVREDGGCTIAALQVQLGSSGDGVTCLQDSLAASGLYEGASHGEFDEATMSAVVELQRQNDLYVDGIVGRETAIALNIWPDEESLVVRTPIPPDGATDLWDVTLSPVGSTGAGAPPLPENSGSGYRVVYDRAGQRVWAVDGEDRIVRSWLVSGSSYGNEQPGTHTVYSRSELSTAWNGKAYLPLMIRYQKTELGNIGFHGIPTHVSDGTVYQTTEELGTRLSGGCQRQHNLDATFLWGFAKVGTKIVVT